MTSIKTIGLTAIALALVTITGCTSLKVKAANVFVSDPIITHADHDQLTEASSKIDGIRYTSMTTTIITTKAAKRTNGVARVDIEADGIEEVQSKWHGEEHVCQMYHDRMNNPETEGLSDIVGNGLALNYQIAIRGVDGQSYTCSGHVDPL
ncbi:hypothetical protein AB6D75_05935 [Vibrio splendidus]